MDTARTFDVPKPREVHESRCHLLARPDRLRKKAGKTFICDASVLFNPKTHTCNRTHQDLVPGPRDRVFEIGCEVTKIGN